MKNASLALQMESRLEKIFSIAINNMSLAVWLGEDRRLKDRFNEHRRTI